MSNLLQSRFLLIGNGLYHPFVRKQGNKGVFYLHRRRSGARRISAECKAEGVEIGRRLDESAKSDGNLSKTFCASNDRFSA